MIFFDYIIIACGEVFRLRQTESGNLDSEALDHCRLCMTGTQLLEYICPEIKAVWEVADGVGWLTITTPDDIPICRTIMLVEPNAEALRAGYEWMAALLRPVGCEVSADFTGEIYDYPACVTLVLPTMCDLDMHSLAADINQCWAAAFFVDNIKN